MLKICYTDSYNRRAKNFLKKHPELRAQYEKTLQLAELNIQHPSLRLHALAGRLKGLHSISINISYRVTLYLHLTEKEIIPIDVGAHDDVY